MENLELWLTDNKARLNFLRGQGLGPKGMQDVSVELKYPDRSEFIYGYGDTIEKAAEDLLKRIA